MLQQRWPIFVTILHGFSFPNWVLFWLASTFRNSALLSKETPCCSNRSSCVKSSKNRKSGQSLFRRSFRVTSWTELVYESYWRWWAKNFNSLFLCILDAKKNIKRKHLEWIKKNPSRYLKICLGVIFKLVLTSLINLTGARQQ